MGGTIGAPKGEGLPGCSPAYSAKLKKNRRFCRHDDIKGSMCLMLQPKAHDRYIVMLRRIFKKIKNMYISFSFFTFNFPCNLTKRRPGDFDMIIMTDFC